MSRFNSKQICSKRLYHCCCLRCQSKANNSSSGELGVKHGKTGDLSNVVIG